jgi:hypothetical protein
MDASGATLQLSACTGDGTLTVHVNAGTAQDAIGSQSPASPESAVITVDNTPPTYVSATPSDGSTFGAVPASIVLTFSEAVNAATGNFSLSGSTCDTTPTISSVTGSGTSTITVNLSGGACTGTETLVLAISMGDVDDLAGNAGSGTPTVTLTHLLTKKVFLSTANYSAGLGGISGADSKCTSDPNNPHDGATYKAMLVDGSNRVACTSANCTTGGASENVDWVLAANTTYVQSDGVTVIGTTTSAGIFTFPLTNRLSARNAYAWTGLRSDFTSLGLGSTCNHWTQASNVSAGEAGLASMTDSNAISSRTITCVFGEAIYCVAQ